MASLRCIAVLALVAAIPAVGVAPTKNSHPGIIVDAITGDPIQAYATAYGSNQKKGDKGDCPYFEETLNETISAPGSGVFTFLVDKAKPSFTAVYCQGGYAWYKVDVNDNSRNGPRVQPDPVLLYPNQQTLSQRGLNSVDAAYLAMGRVLYSAEVNLSYFSRADKDAFDEALRRFSPQERDSLLALSKMGERAVPFTLVQK